jgi:hypothetical protein
MTRAPETQTPYRSRSITLQNAVAATVVALTLGLADTAQAQKALGLPFVGRNQFSASVTERSRDGVSTEKEAVFGLSYGRQLNGDGPVQLSVVARAAARALDATEGGIFDGGLTIAATHNVRAIDGLSVTGAAGITAMVWGKVGPESADEDRGRIVNNVPLSLGMSYDVRVGAATFAPFVSATHAYSRGRDYLNDAPINKNSSWRLGYSTGMSVRFSEMVLSLSNVYREGGMPNRNRAQFTAGMSW